jgi:hypothetical protein
MEVLSFVLKTFSTSLKSRKCPELVGAISYSSRKGESNWLELQYDVFGEN